tara:strand:+ start:5899 stop:6843 length:945 start_codon:yes stop_codon:yes gene_type:complete
MKKLSFLITFIFLNTIIFSQNSKLPMKKLLSEYGFKSKCITVGDVEINYIKKGKGKTTLVFLHGLSSNADAWSKNIEELQKKYTCVALDLPGFGKSSIKSPEYTPSYFAEITHQFIQKLKLKNVVLVGHSMGGQASIKLALKYPNDIQKLVLVAPAGLETFKKENANFMKATYTANFVKMTTNEQIKKNYALNFFKVPNSVDKMIEDRIRIKDAIDFDMHCTAIIKSVAGMLDEPVNSSLTEITQPTLVIFGTNDALIPNHYFNPTLTTKYVGEIASKQIKNVAVNFIEDCGHFAQFEKPKEVNILIDTFIEDK